MKREDEAKKALSECSISTVNSQVDEEENSSETEKQDYSFCSDLEKTENSILHILDDLESDKGKNKSLDLKISCLKQMVQGYFQKKLVPQPKLVVKLGDKRKGETKAQDKEC